MNPPCKGRVPSFHSKAESTSTCWTGEVFDLLQRSSPALGDASGQGEGSTSQPTSVRTSDAVCRPPRPAMPTTACVFHRLASVRFVRRTLTLRYCPLRSTLTLLGTVTGSFPMRLSPHRTTRPWRACAAPGRFLERWESALPPRKVLEWPADSAMTLAARG